MEGRDPMRPLGSAFTEGCVHVQSFAKLKSTNWVSCSQMKPSSKEKNPILVFFPETDAFYCFLMKTS